MLRHYAIEIPVSNTHIPQWENIKHLIIFGPQTGFGLISRD